MIFFLRINWSINFIIWQLIGQVLSDATNVGTSTLKPDANDSPPTMDCSNLELITNNTTKLVFTACSWDIIKHCLSKGNSVKTLDNRDITSIYFDNNDYSLTINCDLNRDHWEPTFDQVNTTKLIFTACSWNIIKQSLSEMKSVKKMEFNKPYNLEFTNESLKNTSIESISFWGTSEEITIPNKFLTNLEHLRYVRFESLELTEVPENMIWNSSNIIELSLADNDLKNLSEKFFQDSAKMKVLDLSQNKIEKINFRLLKPLEQLEKLDLSHNKIVLFESGSLSLPKLKVLILTANCINNFSPNDLFSVENVIETIDLKYNNLDYFDPKWSILKNLTTINLYNNSFTILGVDDFKLFNRNVYVDLGSNPLQYINVSHLVEFANISAPEKQNNEKPRTFFLSSNKFVCDCRNYEFAKFLQGKMPSIVYNELNINENLHCHDTYNSFSKINLDDLICNWDMFKVPNKTNNCSSGCECTYRPHDNSAFMNCSNKYLSLAPEQIISSQNINYTELDLSNNFITEFPDYRQLNIRKLNVSHNNLITINLTGLPKNLEELHLEFNNLKYISEINSNNILTGLKHITMGHNSWDCNCDTGKNTFSFVKEYSSQIDDLNDQWGGIKTSCFLFSNLNQTMEQTCPLDNSLKILYLVTLFIIIIMVIIFIFAFYELILSLIKRYKIKIAIWLYSLGFTWRISEELLDQDKMYDAFISYSSEDLEFVSKHLVPGLEDGNMPFKLCLHYRDWLPGDFIPAQIARSVYESRRTIIVLSKNYLKSVWARTEFRAAYSCALNEQRSRIIVLLYGDISTEDLDPELKSYLSMNTYIKWGEGWFWEKLKYSLPRRPRRVDYTNMVGNFNGQIRIS